MEIIKLKTLNKILNKINNSSFSNDLSKLKINIDKYKKLKDQISEVYNFYQQYEKYFINFPIYCEFNKLLGKSHRFKRIFKKTIDSNLNQIDSKYIFDNFGNMKDEIHIVYSCTLAELEKSIVYLTTLIKFCEEHIIQISEINEIVLSDLAEKEKGNKIRNIFNGLYFKQNKTLIENLLLDFNYLCKVRVPSVELENNTRLIKFYNIDTFENIQKQLSFFNIQIDKSIVSSEKEMIMNLDYETALNIKENLPFLMSTATKNSIKFLDSRFQDNSNEKNEMHSTVLQIPTNLISHKTPIGVIDSYAKFSNGWENYIEINNRELQNGSPDYDHGTGVSSIIIGNDFINEYFKDGLGIFRVKHFGILNQTEIDLTFAMKEIEDIISENHDEIKIWNLSTDVLGERKQSISEFGKFLDRIQNSYDVLVIISAGNHKKVCPGADSLSAITVGALYEKNDGSLCETEYTGKDKIFNRFDKPNTFDIGNDLTSKLKSENDLWMLENNGYIETGADGTSFAAPLVTRKCGYLYDEYGLSLESIRSLINLQSNISQLKGNSKRANIDFENINNQDEKIIIFEGEISPKKTLVETIKLPHVNEKKSIYKDYHLAISTAYKVNNFRNIGDEYSSIEINCKIISDNVLSEVKTNTINTMKTTSDSIEGYNATEIELIDHFKKYDPNKVLIDEKFLETKYSCPFKTKTNELKLLVSCQDLFNQFDNTKVKYGISIFLKGIKPNSLVNFVEQNEEIIQKVFNKVEIPEKIKITE